MDTKKLSFKETLSICIKALRVSLSARSVAATVINMLGFLMAFMPVLISVAVRNFTNEVQTLMNSQQDYIWAALSCFAILAGLYIVQTAFNALQGYFSEVDSEHIRGYVKETIIKNSCRIKYKYIDNFDSYKEKINMIDTEAGKSVASSIQSAVLWVQGLISFISILYVLASVNVFIVIALLVSSIPAIAIATLQNQEDFRYKTSHINDGVRVWHYYSLTARPFAMKEIRFFGLYPFFKKIWSEQANKYIGLKNKIVKKYLIYNIIADVLRNGVYIIIMLFIVKDIFENPVLGLGAFMLVFTMSTQLQDVTTKLFSRAAQFTNDIYYMQIFFNLENLEKEDDDNGINSFEKIRIEFKDVVFCYPGADKKALDGVSVTINQGEKIAIVGENGSGKSTFINLICGMYEPQKGSMQINGEDIIKNVSSVRERISVVFQDFGQYEDTIKENITVSDKSKPVDENELIEISKLTDAYDFIRDQENGFDEILGSYGQNGNNLSGGQWQKIVLARALYRDKAKIIILDEPTAALDPLAEAKIYTNFTKLTGEKTTILISHRLGVTRIVDRILVFHDGKIVEDGKHDELIKNNGLYAKMYQAQAQWYA